jgi:hypothetical protein
VRCRVFIVSSQLSVLGSQFCSSGVSTLFRG